MSDGINENIETEYHRIKSLSDFDLDYGELEDEFEPLVELAAMIAGTQISVINLIDNYFQWTVASKSIKLLQMPREDSVCDRTIRSRKPLEILNLDKDEQFKHQEFSKGKSGFSYYLGIPLIVDSGDVIGALCVLDKTPKTISEKSKIMLGLVASEIVKKLELRKELDRKIFSLNEAVKTKNQLAHDVRGPINGITGLAELAETEDSSDIEKLQYFKLIKESGNSILELTNDILQNAKSIDEVKTSYINSKQLADRLMELYRLPAESKNIDLQVKTNPHNRDYTFSRRKLFSIFGNLISNAIKFTPSNGWIKISLDIADLEGKKHLIFCIVDSGMGVSEDILEDFREKKLKSSLGTSGEKGFGLGLRLVVELVHDLAGEIDIISGKDIGTTIKLSLPLK
ncbi:GAF domain-containing sensor histidine kinase [Gramella sp. MAR_2010_147]|uniref:GAF domain-containing sensor histidine kinase n=1 Tax=Gramella sp. MAR_2010_147 TaxID=1250205 RepID=UPI00087B00AD|nr:GAF domain-containing sensor histidine kinase [Gramella sp. MAR_2010_147]SDS48819.1 GAF domain-containing protein [Gramella sp. MAR_2010_147]